MAPPPAVVSWVTTEERDIGSSPTKIGKIVVALLIALLYFRRVVVMSDVPYVYHIRALEEHGHDVLYCTNLQLLVLGTQRIHREQI